jgi:diphthine-ammonia ligase
MCGIIGALNHAQAWQVVKSGLKEIENRGKDGVGYYDGSVHYAKSTTKLKESSAHNILGHCLHAIVNTVPQPLEHNGSVLTANCEIYNWEELCEKYSLDAKNDSELLLLLLKKLGVEKALKELKGVYAFAYKKDNTLYLARDLLGVKPLWYHLGDGFIFCSEKKGLPNKRGVELNPRQIGIYSLESKELNFLNRGFIVLGENHCNINVLKQTLNQSVKARIPQRKFGLLFSGGLDSVLIAKILKDLGHDVVCYTAAASEDAPDLIASKKAALELGLKLKYKVIKDVHPLLKIVVPLIEDSNVVKIGVALPLYVACTLAKEDGCKVIFAGSGADEIFGGYNRYKEGPLEQLNKDCYSDLLKLYEKNTYRDDVITMNNNLELRVPFLDLDLVTYGLNLSPNLKIKDGVEKYILRLIAKELGISEEFADRKKKAAQYGSGFDKAIEKAGKKVGKNKSEYLKQFYSVPNVRLAALASGGKDSMYAMYTMMQQNYEISCLVTMRSKNKDSYMFQSDGTDLVKLQAESLGINLIEYPTSGEKEKELEDLEEAIRVAKETFGVEGVVSGALYSNYQRTRIEKICDNLGLKMFAPLWHLNQEYYMRDLIKTGFRFVLVKVAADGLDESWLGKVITNKDIDRLIALNEKIGLNISFEGGEAESVVISCPLFKEEILFSKGSIERLGPHSFILKIN